MSVLFVSSHHAWADFDPASRESKRGHFADGVASGRLRMVRDWELTRELIASARGIIVTQHLDQIAMSALRDALDDMLARGGRVVINGHVARPFLSRLSPFAPSGEGRLADLALTELADHPVFDGVDRRLFHAVRGVVGFYGRGWNPPPDGAEPLTGIGPQRRPLDWVWRAEGGGEVLCHAGNDWWLCSDDKPAMERLAANLLAWAEGGAAP